MREYKRLGDTGFEALITDIISEPGTNDDLRLDGVTADEPLDGGEDIIDTVPAEVTTTSDSEPEINRYSFDDGLKLSRIINDFVPAGNVRFSFFGWDVFPETVPVDEKGSYTDLIGGFGITQRPLAEIDEHLPGVKAELLSATGKIMILGNGLSLAPLEVIQERGPDNPPDLTIVDAIQYAKLHDDLMNIHAQCLEAGVMPPPRITDALGRCATLLDAAKSGELKIVRHLFGSGEVPEAARGAEVAVSTFGPPHATIPNQLDCLRTGGRLYTTTTYPHPEGAKRADVKKVPKPTLKADGLIYTKLPASRKRR